MESHSISRSSPDDTARVIEILGIQRASVMGWSMGGFIAQAVALKQFPRGGHAFMAQYPRPLVDLTNSFLALGSTYDTG